MKQLFVFIVLAYCAPAFGQEFKRALFLGNSYTNYNNLPQLTANVALSAGDTLEVGSNLPGGYTFENHMSNMTSMDFIAEGTWDFVVLQQQSQMPAFPLAQVEVETFPFAVQLNDAILSANPCAETVFYMTWGRENGDQQNCANWPPVCTYEGMDDLLRERYLMMAEMNQGIVSPVGAVWRYLRENHPGIQLFASDGSHPSPEGSYAAALSFYTCLFRKSPLNTHYDYTIADSTEAIMRNAVHEVVFNQFSEWYVGSWDPVAAGTVEQSGANEFLLVNNSSFANEISFSLDGGPWNAMTEESAILTISEQGSHSIELIASACQRTDTTVIAFDFIPNRILEQATFAHRLFPNPAQNSFHVEIPSELIWNRLLITDVYGKTIPCTYKADSKGITFDCSSLPEGTYHVSIIGNTFRKEIPLIVLRD